MSLSRMRVLSGWAGLVLIAAAALAQTPPASTPQPLSAAEIVQRMLSHNQAQANKLRHYHDTRHYQAEYKGFGNLFAKELRAALRLDAKRF